jgi:NAD(P) transhydrogenase subunit alpha
MKVGVPKETSLGESRVALIPALVPMLGKLKLDVLVEKGAGAAAGFTDDEYKDAGATLIDSGDEIFAEADIVIQVRAAGANPEAGDSDVGLMREGQVVIGFAEPLTKSDITQAIADKKTTYISMELMPRITRAQSMDALSSMATILGYKAVLLAASELPRMFPMMMTAAGTIKPARVFVIGAGVMGLQAIATARRLGAIVTGYDIRAETKEQILSLGAKFAEMDLDAGESQDAGGYAKEKSEEFLKKQSEAMSQWIAESDVLITTAAIPGRKSPVLVNEDQVKGMAPGSVVVDMASERGGNCEPTETGKTINYHGVKVMGPVNLTSTVPYHASQMYAKNIVTFLQHLVKDGELTLDFTDEITRGTVVTHDGEIKHKVVREIFDLPPLDPPEKEEDKDGDKKDGDKKDGDKKDDDKKDDDKKDDDKKDGDKKDDDKKDKDKDKEDKKDGEKDSDKKD